MCQFCICLCFVFGILHRPSGGTILLRALFLNFVFLFHILSTFCISTLCIPKFCILRRDNPPPSSISSSRKEAAASGESSPSQLSELQSGFFCNLYFCSLVSFAMWFCFAMWFLQSAEFGNVVLYCNVVHVLNVASCQYCNVMQSKPDTFRILKRKRYILVENMFGLFAITKEKKLG